MAWLSSSGVLCMDPVHCNLRVLTFLRQSCRYRGWRRPQASSDGRHSSKSLEYLHLSAFDLIPPPLSIYFTKLLEPLGPSRPPRLSPDLATTTASS